MEKSAFISRSDVRFFIFLVGILSGTIIWGVRLESKANAMTDREQLNKGQFQEVIEKVSNMDKNVFLICTSLELDCIK